MRQSGGKLAESDQPLRSARFGLSLFQAAIGFGQAFGEIAVQLCLMLALLAKRLTTMAARKKNRIRRPSNPSASGVKLVFLHCRVEIGTIGSRSKQGPQQRRPGTAIQRGGHDRNKVDGPVTAVNTDFRRVVE